MRPNSTKSLRFPGESGEERNSRNQPISIAWHDSRSSRFRNHVGMHGAAPLIVCFCCYEQIVQNATTAEAENEKLTRSPQKAWPCLKKSGARGPPQLSHPKRRAPRNLCWNATCFWVPANSESHSENCSESVFSHGLRLERQFREYTLSKSESCSENGFFITPNYVIWFPGLWILQDQSSVAQRTRPYWKYYYILIHYPRSNSLFVEISCEFSPGKQGVSETLPECCATVVFFCHHRCELMWP